MNLKCIGSRIKLHRCHQRLTREQLSEMIDVSPHYIYEVESGLKTMSLKTLDKLTSSLNLSADYILYGEICANSQKGFVNDIDSLTQLTNNLSSEQREFFAKLITDILPYLK